MEVNVGKQKRSHLAYLFSNRGVKDSFNRKLTTKDQNEVDLQGYTWRYAEKKGFVMSEITTK